MGRQRVVQQGSNHGRMRDHNRALLLTLIRILQPISRADLMRETGLTKGSISNIVGALIEARLVLEIKIGESTGGRRPTLLKLASEHNLVGVIDIRPCLTTLAVATLDGHFIRRAVIHTESLTPGDFLERCARQIRDMLLQFRGRTVIGIGLVIPGRVGTKGQIIRNVDVLGWTDVALAPMQEILQFPLVASNDAHAVTLAEHFFGNKGGHADFGQIRQSDGISVGIMQNGTLMTGASNRAGDINHMVIDMRGERCACGQRGCLGLFASGEGIARRFQMQTPRQRPFEPAEAVVSDLQATTEEHGVQLTWTAASPYLTQFAVFRHDRSPVPTDALHCIGLTAEPSFVDQSEYSGLGYYTVCMVEADGRQGLPAAPVSCTPNPPNKLFEDDFAVGIPAAYRRRAAITPELVAGRDGGVRTGSENGEEGHTFLWRDNLRAGVFTAVVRPLHKGRHDTCGLLFKYKDARRWYCAALAYGSDLVSRQTLSLIRQAGNSPSELLDEWLGFYQLDIREGHDYVIKVMLDEGWIRAKAWLSDEIEPSDWQIVLRDDSGWNGGAVGFRCFGRQALLRSFSARALPLSPAAEMERPVQYDYCDATLNLLAERARQGDQLARNLLQEMGHALGIGLINLQASFEIDHFYCTGSLLDANLPWLSEALQDTIKPSSTAGRPLTLESSSLGDDATLLGAVAVASQPIFTSLGLVRPPRRTPG